MGAAYTIFGKQVPSHVVRIPIESVDPTTNNLACSLNLVFRGGSCCLASC